jgi:hypothetical protein
MIICVHVVMMLGVISNAKLFNNNILELFKLIQSQFGIDNYIDRNA